MRCFAFTRANRIFPLQMDDRELSRHFAAQREAEQASFSVLERLADELASLESARAATRLGRAQGLPSAEDHWAVGGPGARFERSDFEEALEGLCEAAGAGPGPDALLQNFGEENSQKDEKTDDQLKIEDFENPTA